MTSMEPHPPSSGVAVPDSATSAGGPRSGRRAERGPKPKDLAGLRIVTTGRNRRGALARCMMSARDLAERGAEVCYSDGGSEDGSVDLVRLRFGFVEISADREALLLPIGDAAPPRFVVMLDLSASLTATIALALMLRIARLESGLALAPRIVAGDGTPREAPAAGDAWEPPVWIARRADLMAGGPLRIQHCDRIAALVL